MLRTGFPLFWYAPRVLLRIMQLNKNELSSKIDAVEIPTSCHVIIPDPTTWASLITQPSQYAGGSTIDMCFTASFRIA
jgi:hypothetical protein